MMLAFYVAGILFLVACVLWAFVGWRFLRDFIVWPIRLVLMPLGVLWPPLDAQDIEDLHAEQERDRRWRRRRLYPLQRGDRRGRDKR